MHALFIQKENKLEISHLYYLISAYEATNEGLEEFRVDLQQCIKEARLTKQTQIFSYDRCDFVLHVFPSGVISLMGELKHFDEVEFS